MLSLVEHEKSFITLDQTYLFGYVMSISVPEQPPTIYNHLARLTKILLYRKGNIRAIC